MFELVKEFIDNEKLINNNDSIIMGISGGADSICLLCVLSRLRDIEAYGNLNLYAVHINHGLRETALRDQKFTEEISRRFNIPFYPVLVDVIGYAEEKHMSTEEAGRILRYNAFNKIAADLKLNSYKIAVAHNSDDNAETMLFNMIRGTGIKGLSGISARRDNIIRPLLCVSREEIEGYLDKHNMDYCTDETNLTDDYSRNKIRHKIKPVCGQINENYLNRFYELSSQVTEAEDYLSITTLKELKKISTENNDGSIHIQINLFNELHIYMQKRVILEAIGMVAGAKKDIGSVHVDIVCDLFKHQVGKSVSLPYGVKVVREYGGIRLYKGSTISKGEQLQEKKPLNIEGTTIFDKYTFEVKIYNLKENRKQENNSSFLKWFDYDKILLAKNSDNMMVRYREQGDVICINENGSRKKLKSYFVDEKIPSDMRHSIPVIAMGNNILLVAGYRASSEFKVTDATKRILEIKVNIKL